jgi:hypothetical protein
MNVKPSIIALMFVVLIGSAFSQDAQNGPKPDPSKMTNDEIVSHFRETKNGCDYDWELADELVGRTSPKFLIESFRGGDECQRHVLLIELFKIQKPEVLAFMRDLAFTNLTNEPDGEPRWYPLQYLADRCDLRALRRFNRDINWKDEYPIGCMWWTGTVRQFGKCGYRPAIPHLIRYTNSVACLNISDAAIESLMALYPGKCKSVTSMDQAHDCFLSEYKKEKRTTATSLQEP